MLADEHILSFISLSAHIQPTEFYQLLLFRRLINILGECFDLAPPKLCEGDACISLTLFYSNRGKKVDKKDGSFDFHFIMFRNT